MPFDSNSALMGSRRTRGVIEHETCEIHVLSVTDTHYIKPNHLHVDHSGFFHSVMSDPWMNIGTTCGRVKVIQQRSSDKSHSCRSENRHLASSDQSLDDHSRSCI